jgi:hypothetical protein
MPTNWLGEQITFGVWSDPDSKTRKYVWVRASRNETIKQMAARRGHTSEVATIVQLNKGRDVLPHPKRKPHHSAPPVPKLRTATQHLRAGARIKLPGNMGPGSYFSVNAGAEPPLVKAGYAKYDVVDIPGRIGLNRFLGYDPIAVDIAVQFENYAAGEGAQIEQNIRTLERMAGRGDYPGAAVGPPAVVSVSASDAQGNPVPLLPPDYQWFPNHQNAPLFRITAIAWDAGALRNDAGFRTRQTGTITITQYTPVEYVERSVSRRAFLIPARKTPHHKKR